MIRNETNRVELKEKLTDDFEKTAVAFLNSDGGDIYIGINKDGIIAGVPNPDAVQLKIADRLKDNIRPSVMGLFDISTEIHDNKTVVVVNLASGSEKPYCIKQKGYCDSGCFIRIGSSSQPMQHTMIDKLLRKRHHPSIANMPSRRQDLEFKQLKLYYGLKDKPLNDNFATTLDFLTQDGKYNIVAFLFADNNNISVRMGKYFGKDKLDLIGREDYKDCCLITAMQRIIDRIDVENITQSRKRPMQTRLDKNLVDKKILHEVIINAFAHNDYSRLDTPIFQIYSDRIEITSFGGLVDGLTLEKFYGGTSMPRNREIMRVLKDLEFVEQLGSGIPKIVNKYGKNVISVSEKVIEATLMFDCDMDEAENYPENLKNYPENSENYPENSENYPENPENYPENSENYPENPENYPENSENYPENLETTLKASEKILAVVSENPKISIPEIAELLGLSVGGIKYQVKRLKDKGVMHRIGPDKGGSWEITQS